MKDISSQFQELEALLRKYGFVSQANTVRDGLAAIQAEGTAGYARLAGPDWWGGAGSVADVYLYKEGESFTVGQERDNRALGAALTGICKAMRASGVVDEAAEAWFRSH